MRARSWVGVQFLAALLQKAQRVDRGLALGAFSLLGVALPMWATMAA